MQGWTDLLIGELLWGVGCKSYLNLNAGIMQGWADLLIGELIWG